jgi:hypothetical protein
MGLTAFNRQRRIALQKKVGDQTIADKLYANGYTHFSMLADASAEDLSFLSEKQLQKLNKTGSTEPTVQENKDALPGLTIEELNEALELESNAKTERRPLRQLKPVLKSWSKLIQSPMMKMNPRLKRRLIPNPMMSRRLNRPMRLSSSRKNRRV